ncbi:MAG: peptide deformylase [Steroidobacteraceae bacterium]|jgi:peptide deformylase|nr:peptide deformylase [Steroidobacteraceae bacterium]
MAILPILEYPDPRLRLRAEPVDAFDDDLARLVDDLCDTLRASKGIGLAAPQAGDRRRVLVMDLSGGAASPDVYINPEIHDPAVPGLVEESCLSVPGVVGNVVRATQLTVCARDRYGAAFERRLEGMHAVCLQHELDHLEGRLFVDRLSIFRRVGVRLGAVARARSRAASI